MASLLVLVGSLHARDERPEERGDQGVEAPPDARPDDHLNERLQVATDLARPPQERIEATRDLLTEVLTPAAIETVAKAFAERGRRELVALLEQTLSEPHAPLLAWSNAARLAEVVPDPALAPPLLARLEQLLAGEPARAGEVVPALRAALDATRRRLLELEIDRLAKALPEAALAALDHTERDVRRAALARLLELAQRPDTPRNEVLARANSVARERLSGMLTTARGALAGALDHGPLDHDELRRLAELAVVLSDGDELLTKELLAALESSIDSALRVALLPALRRIPRDRGGGEVARTLSALLAVAVKSEPTVGSAPLTAPSTSPATAPSTAPSNPPSTASPTASPIALWAAQWSAPFIDGSLDLLRLLGDEASLEVIGTVAAQAGSERAHTRELAISAAAEIARRASAPPPARLVVDLLTRALAEDPAGEVRLAAAVGLSQLLDTIAARLRSGTVEQAVDAETMGRTFDAMRFALPSALRDRAFAEPICKVLCHVPGREAAAAALLADALLEGAPAAAVREVLLRGLKELGHADGVRAIVAALPKGGPSVEPDAIGREAFAALRAVLRQATTENVGVATELDVVDRCLELREAEWAYYFAVSLLEEVERPDHVERATAIRLQFARAVVAGHDAAPRERAFTECERVAGETAAETPAGRLARMIEVDLGEQLSPVHAQTVAERAAELMATLPAGAVEREVVAVRVAALLFFAGEWSNCSGWLDQEIDEASASNEVLVMKARAAARREGAAALLDARRLLELLLGRGGQRARLAADDSQRTALGLALAAVYFDAGNGDAGRTLLAELPAEEALSDELKAERRRLDERAKEERSKSGG